MKKGHTIHSLIAEQTDLAKTYAEDGAFKTAASVLRRLASTIDEHVVACCPGHVASKGDPKVCAFCGVHIDTLR